MYTISICFPVHKLHTFILLHYSGIFYGDEANFIAITILDVMQLIYCYFLTPESLKVQNRKQFTTKNLNPLRYGIINILFVEFTGFMLMDNIKKKIHKNKPYTGLCIIVAVIIRLFYGLLWYNFLYHYQRREY